jgi:hypothetical protein
VWSLSQDSADALNSKLQEEIEKLQEDTAQTFLAHLGSGSFGDRFDVHHFIPPEGLQNMPSYQRNQLLSWHCKMCGAKLCHLVAS